MQKGWELIKLAYIKALTYRSEIFLWLVLESIPLIALFAIWRSLFQQESSIQGYSLAMILTYYLLATIIDGLTGVHFEDWRVQEIREGKIDFYLIKPLSYLKEILWRNLGGKAFYLSLALPFFGLLFFWLSLGQQLSLPAASLSTYLVFLGLLLTAYLAEFLMGTIIVLSGFWLEQADGGEHFKWIITALFGGRLIPLEMMPTWLKKATLTLPFKYKYAIPIGYLQGQQNLRLSDLLYIGSYLLILWLIVNYLWRKAKFKYTSHGG